MLKLCIKIVKYYFTIISLVFLILTGILCSQFILCNEKIEATPILARENKNIKFERLSENITYTYIYKDKTYMDEDYTTLEKAKEVKKYGYMYIWVCKQNPNISSFDKKGDLIIILLLMTIASIYITVILFTKDNKTKDKTKK